MPRAERGSIKDLANRLKSKGLQRLRWYCQACEKQMRDENGFKQHTQSEGHVRQMLIIGENPHKHIKDFSSRFQNDFVHLLRASHGTKFIHFNHFYNEYISNKQHLHMNATRWKSLTEFIKHLERCGIVKTYNTDSGLQIAWIDNSPDELARQESIRQQEKLRADEEKAEKAILQHQIIHAKKNIINSKTHRSRELNRSIESAPYSFSLIERSNDKNSKGSHLKNVFRSDYNKKNNS